MLNNSGHFHADEALAVYMLRMLTPYKHFDLVRTRDPAILETCHTVVDVGGEYDAARNRYDHHQRTFDTTFYERRTKLSSAGLVYMHFGKTVIAQHTKLPIDHPDVELLYQKLYDDFIEAVDANDNGISKYDDSKLKAAGIQAKFKDGGVTLASLVGDLNNPDPLNPKIPDSTPEEAEDARFSEASQMMGAAFLRKMHSAANSWLPARETVKNAFEQRKTNHPSGRIMVLPKAGVPWKEHLYKLEEAGTVPSDEKPFYVLYGETEEVGSKWRVQAVSKDFTSFESRKALPERWRGLRNTELDKILANDVEDGAVFVHASGFIGGHQTEAGAKAMAIKALEM